MHFNIDYLPGAHMFSESGILDKSGEESGKSLRGIFGPTVALLSFLGCTILVLLAGSDGSVAHLVPWHRGRSSPQILPVVLDTKNANFSTVRSCAKDNRTGYETGINASTGTVVSGGHAMDTKYINTLQKRLNGTTLPPRTARSVGTSSTSARTVTKTRLEETANYIRPRSSEWSYQCHSPRLFVRCSSANVPSPPNLFYYEVDAMGNGRCERWVNGDECLDGTYNAFSTLSECRRICENTTEMQKSSDRCSMVVSRPCSPPDRRFEYVYHNDLNGSACVRLPGRKCTTREYGFPTRKECLESCHPRKIGTDPRCKPGAEGHDCQRHDRKYPFYYDDEEGKCLPWTDICLVSGFPDKETCEIVCSGEFQS
ncbi:uncharacterized protein LOC135400280 isoform X2 [Ornithodoros turicata]|uniref:uncharacterized protein LOC135400280 isoform X2 n=1 Tax=Ornithodoros turicata TaxID=34597 RepID=UPI003139D93B